MSDHRTRSGARLRGHHRGFTFRIAQTTSSDYTQPKCAQCGKPISDDRLEAGGSDPEAERRFCSDYCAERSSNGNIGRVRIHGVLSGRETVWKKAYEQAKSSPGSEIAIACDDRLQANRRANTFNQRRDFQARQEGLIVYLRFVGAA